MRNERQGVRGTGARVGLKIIKKLKVNGFAHILGIGDRGRGRYSNEVIG